MWYSCLIYKKEKIQSFGGINHGQFTMESRGNSRLGFDPIFLSEDSSDRTFVEENITRQNKISYKRRAMMKFMEFLELKEENKMS